MTLRSLLAHVVLVVLLTALLFSAQFGLDALGLSGTRVLPAILIIAVAVPASIIASSKIGPLSVLGSAAATFIAAAFVWGWLLMALRNIALPVEPDTTLWQVASYNEPAPFLRLWVFLAVSAVLWLLLLRWRASERPVP